MNREAMENMSAGELDAYARVLGIDLRGTRGAQHKMEAITRRRERRAEIRVLGMDLEVPIRRAHDKRVNDLLSGRRSDADMVEALRLLLGEEQFEAVEAACTEDDGVFDVEAFAYAAATVLGSPDLKNF